MSAESKAAAHQSQLDRFLTARMTSTAEEARDSTSRLGCWIDVVICIPMKPEKFPRKTIV